MSKVRNPFYICTECDVTFELLSWPKANTRKKYCPMCGDDFAVKAFRPKEKDGKAIWTDEEVAWIDECIDGKLSIYALAHKSGRKLSAIRSRIGRRRRELDIKTGCRPSWSDDEKALAKKCVDKEITIKDVMAETGKSFEAVRAYVSRMRTKRRKDNESNSNRIN